jgi:O-antigen biosynthesis protein WbqP
LIAVVAIAILAVSGTPVFIVQQRVGADEVLIKVVKFRTMVRGAPLVAKELLPQDAKIYAPFGRALRRWSLDELPQIVQVVAGSMSLVGPRPALPSQHDLLALRRRYGITAQKPGLTGLAQVKGREALTLPTKVRFERLYARRRSFRLDLMIVLWTARSVLSGRGAY